MKQSMQMMQNPAYAQQAAQMVNRMRNDRNNNNMLPYNANINMPMPGNPDNHNINTQPQ